MKERANGQKTQLRIDQAGIRDGMESCEFIGDKYLDQFVEFCVSANVPLTIKLLDFVRVAHFPIALQFYTHICKVNLI